LASRAPREKAFVARSEDVALRNERLFREANEKIAARRDELHLTGATPFLCECEDESCTAIVRLSVDEYRQVRAQPHTFVVVPGHPTKGRPTDVGGDGWLCVSKEELL
jgi:hypothetical protein